MKKSILLLVSLLLISTPLLAADIIELTKNIQNGFEEYGKDKFMISFAYNLNTYTPVNVGPGETVIDVSYNNNMLTYQTEITGHAKDISLSSTKKQQAYGNNKIQQTEISNGCKEPNTRALLNNGIIIRRTYVTDEDQSLFQFDYNVGDCFKKLPSKTTKQNGKNGLSDLDKKNTIKILQTISSQKTDTLRKKMWESEFGKIDNDDIDNFFKQLAKNMANNAPMRMNQYQVLTSAIYMQPAKLLRYAYVIEGIQDTMSSEEFRESVHQINQNNYCTNSKLWWARIGGVDVTHSYKDSSGKSILVDRIMHGNCK